MLHFNFFGILKLPTRPDPTRVQLWSTVG